tara:strand:- start:174 stop:431 length:258 start_codon:yes stop_codon:yes gene_type:complete
MNMEGVMKECCGLCPYSRKDTLFSNVPEELEEVFGMYNEDEGSYSEMKRLKGIANQRGYDFDYGLDGEPTEFWEMIKHHTEKHES